MELPKTMLIIKSNSMALSAVETFLRNRGWKIYSTPVLKDALVQLTTNKPSYVLVSVDHPNKKVRSLPKLLQQAFPVATIAFAENQTSSSYKLLNESPTDYRVYPPVTGPAIERCVHKYLKDLDTKEKMKSASNDFNGMSHDKDENGVISVKGGAGGNIEIKGGTPAGFGTVDAGKLLSQFLGEDQKSVVGSAQKSPTKNDSNLVFAQPLDEEDPGSLRADESPKRLGETFVQKGSEGHLGNHHDHPNKINSLSGSQGGANGHAMNGMQGTDTNGSTNAGYNPGSLVEPDAQKNALGSADEKAIGLGSREYRRTQTQNAAWAPAEVDPKAPAEIKLRGHARPKLKDDSLIVRGTQNALNESADVGDGVLRQKVEASTNMACIVVESARFSGYLVAVMGKDQKIDSSFIELIKKRLFKFLNDNGEKIPEGRDTMGLKIKEVDFEPWATEYADFLKKSVHQGNEVAMAFFPRRPLDVIMEESKHQDMAKIGLSDLKGDSAVEFDLYVYLPTNNKYVLYTPKGAVFYNKQLDRLKKQGVTHMHVPKHEAASISKYQAQNYLNDLVDDYKNTTSPKSAPKAS